MRFSYFGLLVLVAQLDTAIADWSLTLYTSGCPANPQPGGTDSVAGGPDDQLWCIATDSSHDIAAFDIAEDNMVVTLFSDPQCLSGEILSFDSDGCQVIPENTVIGAVRVLPADS
ncbi:hypothetical protein F5Y16DRAFT_423012 [Xylariaceae sp. FL0255]|nr:hypothetical protein F5Y16DRAFT_423012 [Xylariaceae sp. FL0255]